MKIKVKRLVIFLHCWFFGHVPDDKNTVFDTDEYTYGWHMMCKRCGILDIEQHELMTGSRSYKVKQFVIFWLYRRWCPEPCKDCGSRFGKHDNCIPF